MTEVWNPVLAQLAQHSNRKYHPDRGWFKWHISPIDKLFYFNSQRLPFLLRQQKTKAVGRECVRLVQLPSQSKKLFPFREKDVSMDIS